METNPPEGAPSAVNLITFEQAKRYFTESCMATAENDQLCMRDVRFYHGEQLSDKHRKRLADRDQPPVIVPRLQSAINGVLGLVDASESSPECLPNDPDHQDAADIGTKVLRSLAEQAHLERIIQKCSEDKFTYGTCAAVVGEGAKTGDTRFNVTHIYWEDFVADPLSRDHDFQDARWLGVARWATPGEIAATYPEAYVEIGSPTAMTSTFLEPKDNEWRLKFWIDTENKKLRVVELYVLGDNKQWQRIVFCQAGVLDQGLSVYKDDQGNSICPIVAVSYQINRLTGERYGPIRQAISLQEELNSRRSKMLHVSNSRQLMITDANADPADKEIARKEAAKPNGVISFGYGPVPTQDVFEGNAALLAQTERDFDRLFPTPAVLGQAASGDSGRAFQLLQQAGYTEWSRTFQRFDDFQKEIYRRLWFCAKQWMTAQAAVRITNEVRAPVFAQVNVPIMGVRPMPVAGPDGQPSVDPITGQPRMQLQQVPVGMKNEIAKMDVDVILTTVPKTDTLPQESFAEVMRYAASMQMSPLSPEFEAVLAIAPMPDKTKTIERLRATREQLQQQAAQQQQQQVALAQQEAQLHALEMQAKAQKNAAQAHKAEADAQRTSFETQMAVQDQAVAHHLLMTGLPTPLRPNPTQ